MSDQEELDRTSGVLPPKLPFTTVPHGVVYSEDAATAEPFFETDWSDYVQFFVGRNGSGKSRTAQAIVDSVANTGSVLRLSTDRLAGMMSFINHSFGTDYQPYQGAPIGEEMESQARLYARKSGYALDALHVLREQPDVTLRLSALLQRAFGRRLRLDLKGGFIDPTVERGDVSYSLLRDEGHGLRQLVILLAYVYRSDWQLLVIDEPELHLHPSLARLWLAELQKECRRTNRRALIVTHAPELLNPKSLAEMRSIWVFQPGVAPKRLGVQTAEQKDAEIADSLRSNPNLVSDLVFSPRPVLVEGVGDVAAFVEASTRSLTTEQLTQTDFVPCGGKSRIPLWFQIAIDVGLDVRVVADLDALFEQPFRRAMESITAVKDAYRIDLQVDPESTAQALQVVIRELAKGGATYANDTEKSLAIANLAAGTAAASRRDAVLKIWRTNGVWLHPQGRLEEVLGLTDHGHDQSVLKAAAAVPGLIDSVVEWSAFDVDTSIDLRKILVAELERIGSAILMELGLNPGRQFTSPPTGAAAITDALLVDVKSREGGVYRLTVKTPQEFSGQYMDVTREVPMTQWALCARAEHVIDLTKSTQPEDEAMPQLPQ